MKNSSGNTNTLLLVVIIVLLVGFGVWYFNRPTKTEDTGGIKIEATLPSGNDSQN